MGGSGAFFSPPVIISCSSENCSFNCSISS
jgi:hypothetical protein